MAVNPQDANHGPKTLVDDGEGPRIYPTEKALARALEDFRTSTGRAMRYAVRKTLARMDVSLEKILQAPVDALDAEEKGGGADHRVRLLGSRLLLQASGVLAPDPLDEPMDPGLDEQVIDQDAQPGQIASEYLRRARAAITGARGSSEVVRTRPSALDPTAMPAPSIVPHQIRPGSRRFTDARQDDNTTSAGPVDTEHLSDPAGD